MRTRSNARSILHMVHENNIFLYNNEFFKDFDADFSQKLRPYWEIVFGMCG